MSTCSSSISTGISAESSSTANLIVIVWKTTWEVARRLSKWLRDGFSLLVNRSRGEPQTRWMAYECSGNCNQSMVENMRKAGIVRDERAVSAMLEVDRGDFCPRSPYIDCPQSIGANATISAPHMHAAALDRLAGHLVEGSRVLDVGYGSGYLTACISLMIGKSGVVVGIDHIDELVSLSERNISLHHSDLLHSRRVRLVCGDGRKGYRGATPYSAIHVGAAASSIPEELLSQLADGGRMLIPVGVAHQEFLQIDREGDRFVQRKLHDVIYVPLTSKEVQLSRR